MFPLYRFGRSTFAESEAPSQPKSDDSEVRELEVRQRMLNGTISESVGNGLLLTMQEKKREKERKAAETNVPPSISAKADHWLFILSIALAWAAFFLPASMSFLIFVIALKAIYHSIIPQYFNNKAKPASEESEVRELIWKGTISESVGNGLLLAMQEKKEKKEKKETAQGTIFAIKEGFGFVDIGRPEKVYFKFSNCYENPSVGQHVTVELDVRPTDGRTFCSAVYLNKAFEVLRKASDDLYDFTGGHITVDPSRLTPEIATSLLATVKKLTREERKRRKDAISRAMAAFRKAASAQVVFLVDCTGSMQSYISAAKDGIRKIMEGIQEGARADGTLEFAFVGYRDFNDKAVDKLLFVSDPSIFQNHLNDVRADGGGDQCEDVLGGLIDVDALNWASNVGNKLIFHIADAPCHGTFFAKGAHYNDDHPSVDSDGSKMKSLLKSLCGDKNANYIFLKINNSTDNMVSTFNELLKGVTGSPEIVTHRLESADDIVKLAINSTVESITSSLSAADAASTVDGGLAKSEYLDKVKRAVSKALPTIEEDDEEKEELNEREAGVRSVGRRVRDKSGSQHVECITMCLPESTNALRYSLKIKDTKVKHFSIDEKVFNKGGCREVCGAIDTTHEKPIHYVLKLHRVRSDPATEKSRCLDDMQCQSVAAFLAQEYCKIPAIGRTVKYLKSQVIKFKTSAGDIRYGSIERVLDSEFVKWCSNAVYQKPADDPLFSATLAAFSHWTHEVTNGFLMVVDIQGVRSGEEFILTDPAIHCVATEKFGQTNLGEAGMDAFFKGHSCNSICKALKLHRHRSQEKGVETLHVGTMPV